MAALEGLYYRRRNQFGGMKADAKGLKELERENATLKRILAIGSRSLSRWRRFGKGDW